MNCTNGELTLDRGSHPKRSNSVLEDARLTKLIVFIPKCFASSITCFPRVEAAADWIRNSPSGTFKMSRNANAVAGLTCEHELCGHNNPVVSTKLWVPEGLAGHSTHPELRSRLITETIGHFYLHRTYRISIIAMPYFKKPVYFLSRLHLQHQPG